MLVEEHKLDAVIKLPSGVFRPYAGVSTAILLFTKTGVGGTDHVWFYDVQADGWSLDDKRTPLLPTGEARADAAGGADRDEHGEEQPARRRAALGDARRRGARATAHGAELLRAEGRDRSDGGYDLSLNRYKEVEHEEVEHQSPAEIIAELKRLEAEISEGLTKLEEMVG